MPRFVPPVIESLDDWEEPIKIAAYGDSGSGKTTLGGTAENALIIALEPGTISAKRSGSKAKVVYCDDWPKFQYVIDQAAKGALDKYQWLIIDPLHMAQQYLMQWLTMSAAEANPSNRDEDTPAIQDYGKAQSMFRRYVTKINGLPHNVLYLLSAMDSEDEEGNRLVMPNLTGKNGTADPTNMSKWFMGTLHAYGYLKVRRTEEGEDARRLIFRRSGPYFGKDRYGVLTPHVDNPTIPQITDLIEGTGAPVRRTTTKRKVR